jgi:hypothetical protein
MQSSSDFSPYANSPSVILALRVCPKTTIWVSSLRVVHIVPQKHTPAAFDVPMRLPRSTLSLLLLTSYIYAEILSLNVAHKWTSELLSCARRCAARAERNELGRYLNCTTCPTDKCAGDNNLSQRVCFIYTLWPESGYRAPLIGHRTALK